MFDVSVVIVNYNVREFLAQALVSVSRSVGDLRTEVFVVDNNSVDGSAQMVADEYPEVRLIVNKENVGFATANNQALRLASGRHILLLNPDTIVQEDTLSSLVAFLDDHPEAGAVGCQILNPDGSFAFESRRSFPTPRVALFRVLGLSRLFPRSPIFGRYNLSYLPIDEMSEVDALSGSCMMIRRAALVESESPASAVEVGPVRPIDRLLDEQFFMYGEDLDLCYRIQQAGWRIFYTPSTSIIHYKGESTKKGDLQYVRYFYGAMLLFTRKHFDSGYSRLFAWILQVGIVGRALISAAHRGLAMALPGLTDWILTAVAVFAATAFRTASSGVEAPPSFLLAVVPLYASVTVLVVMLSGGYQRGSLPRARPVLLGLGAAMITTSVAAFFVKELAFSRIVILVSGAVAAALLIAWRGVLSATQKGTPKAVVVGSSQEALRLARMLAAHPSPPFSLVGLVSPDEETVADDPAPFAIVGRTSQLRDLVRLNRIDDIVFAYADLSRHETIRLVRQLRGLRVRVRTLAAGGQSVIGKETIDDFSMPTVVRSFGDSHAPATRMSVVLFNVLFVLTLVVLAPVLAVLRLARGRKSVAGILLSTVAEVSWLASGRLRLVGYDGAAAYRPPADWGLAAGFFHVADSLDLSHPTQDELNRAHWFYVNNVSVSTQWQIIRNSIRSRIGRKPPKGRFFE